MLQGASKSANADGLSQCNYMQNSATLQSVIGTKHKFLELSEEHIILPTIPPRNQVCVAWFPIDNSS